MIFRYSQEIIYYDCLLLATYKDEYGNLWIGQANLYDKIADVSKFYMAKCLKPVDCEIFWQDNKKYEEILQDYTNNQWIIASLYISYIVNNIGVYDYKTPEYSLIIWEEGHNVFLAEK